MNIALHVRIVGGLLLLLSAVNLAMPHYFGWKSELKAVSLLTRQIFSVHCFFIALLVGLFGALSLFGADLLLRPDPLSRTVLAGMLLFWLCRLAFQWFVYDAAIWRGNPFYTAMHALFSLLWMYISVTFGAALAAVW